MKGVRPIVLCLVKRSGDKVTILIVYVDDIVVTWNDIDFGILNTYERREFEAKHLGILKYFLEIKVARFKKGIVILQ